MAEFEETYRHAEMKLDTLTALAGKDRIYRECRNNYSKNKRMYEEYLLQMPKNMREVISMYAENGRLMNLRLCQLACRYMEFVPEEMWESISGIWADT